MSTNALQTPTKTVDPVIVEIIRNGLFAVTEEMKTNLMRTAYNLIIYEALDFTRQVPERGQGQSRPDRYHWYERSHARACLG